MVPANSKSKLSDADNSDIHPTLHFTVHQLTKCISVPCTELSSYQSQLGGINTVVKV